MKISKYSIIAFLLYQGIIIRIQYLGNLTRIEQAIVAGLFLFFMLDFVKYSRSYNKFLHVNVAMLTYAMIVVLSGFVNRNTTVNNTFLASIVYSITIVDCVIGFEFFYRRKALKNAVNTFYCLTVFYLFVTYLIMLLRPSLSHELGEYYLIGNKFTVAGLHLLAIALAMSMNKKKMVKVLFVTGIAFAIYMNAITGLAGMVILGLLCILPEHVKEKIITPIGSVAIFLGSTSVLFLYNGILMIPAVQRFLVMFGKESTMNSRMFIYSRVLSVIEEKKILGWGFNSSYEILMHRRIGVNTQNGLLEIVFQFGVLGALALIVWIVCVFAKNRQQMLSKTCYPVAAFILVKFITASVEISIGNTFFCMLGCLWALTCFEGNKNYLQGETG